MVNLVTVLGLAASVIAIITGVHYLTNHLAGREFKKLPFRKVRRGVQTIIGKLRRDNFIPDLVVGIGRSGAILGGLIAGNMGNLPLALVDRKLTWDERKRDVVLSDFCELKFGPEHQKILVVIGEVYTAESLKEVTKSLESHLAGREHRTATLVQHQVASVKINYVAYTVTKKVVPAWVFSQEYRRH